jgi:hypothetical protein
MAGIRFAEDIARQRKDTICRLGQPVRISVDVWPSEEEGGLIVLSLTPLANFLHLVADPDACIREYGPYHVSLCQRALATEEELDKLRQELDGKETTLPIAYVSGEGCMELGACSITEGLARELHDREGAWYRDRPMHISG